MTQDFAKRKRSQRRTLPGWLWLVTGVIAGLFIGFLVYLTKITPSVPLSQLLPAPMTEPEATQTTTPAINKTPAAVSKQRPKFDFYTLLPESEVVVPGQLPTPEVKPTSTAQKTTATDTKATETHTVYLLQVGSFRNKADAEQLRAQILLLGLEARTEAVDLRSGETWHRVQVGPFASSDKLNSAQAVLAQHNISSLLLKQKTP